MFEEPSEGEPVDWPVPAPAAPAWHVPVLPPLPSPGELSDDDLSAAARQCQAAKAAWDARLLNLAAETYRRAATWLLPSASQMTPAVGQIEAAGQELALSLDLTLDSGCNLVDLALTVTMRLTAVAAALSAGVVDLPRARLIAELTQPLPDPAAQEVANAALRYAPGHTYSQLRQKLRRLVLHADPAGAESRRREAAVGRSLRMLPAEDGMADLWLHAPAERVTATFNVVDHAARELRRAGDARGLDALRADLLTDLVLAGAGGTSGDKDGGVGRTGETGGHGEDAAGRDGTEDGGGDGNGIAGGDGEHPPRGWLGGRVLLRITGSAGALLSADDSPGELDGYGPISADLLRELAYTAGAVWQPLLADPEKIPVRDPGRYVPPPRLAAAVRAVDGTCRWPGCRQPAWRCDLDHAVPHAAGGVTKADNLAAMCRSHHRLKTHTKWKVRLDEQRRLHVTSPLGQTATTRPRHRAPGRDP
jgi:Domain of unknown function (DUF222)